MLTDAFGLFVLEPVAGFGEREELGVVTIMQTVLGHFGREKYGAFAPLSTARNEIPAWAQSVKIWHSAESALQLIHEIHSLSC